MTEISPGVGLMAPRVAICAGHQANKVLQLITGQRTNSRDLWRRSIRRTDAENQYRGPIQGTCEEDQYGGPMWKIKA